MLVLDEADRLLELGFKDELLTIMGKCSNTKRQTLMGGDESLEKTSRSQVVRPSLCTQNNHPNAKAN